MVADPGGVLIIGGGLCASVVASRLAEADVPFRIVCPTESTDVSRVPRQAPIGRHRHRGLALGWREGLGGTTRAWGGQLWPWEAHDHRADWPQWVSALPGHYRYVGELLDPGFGDFHAAGSRTAEATAALWPQLSRVADLRSSTWLPRRRRSVEPLLKRLIRQRRCSLVNGRAIRIGASGQRTVIEVENRAGQREELTCGVAVIASGTIEAISLLDRSRDSASQWPELGSGIVDHVSFLAATIHTEHAPERLRCVGERYDNGRRRTPKLLFVDPRSGRRGYAHLTPAPPRPTSFTAALTAATNSLQSALYERRRPAPWGFALRVDVEQQITDGHRFELTDDQRGLVWDVTAADRDLATHISRRAIECVRRVVPDAVVEPVDEVTGHDIYHLMGGTSDLLNSELRLTDQPHVAIVGLSVFPEAGVANPSYLAAALSSCVGADIASQGG